jgi:hypothetical protein
MLLVEFANALLDPLQSYRVGMPHRSAPVGRKTVAVQIDDVDVDCRSASAERCPFSKPFRPLLYLRGKGFEYDVSHAPSRAHHNINPEMETLLRVNYDLRWQTSYHLSEPRFLKTATQTAGGRLVR